MLSLLLPIGLGMFVGAILALTGAGGAILSVPLLVFFMGLSLTAAAPIALFALMVAASVAAIIGIRNGYVRYKSALLMAGIGMSMAPLGVMLSSQLPLTVLSLIFAFVLLVIAIRMAWSIFRQMTLSKISVTDENMAEESLVSVMLHKQGVFNPVDKTAPACQINPVTSQLFWTARCTARLSLTGLFAGLLSGLLGVGGGFVIVPALRAVSNFNATTIVATSLMTVALVSAAGFASYAVTSAIQWPIAVAFAFGTLSGLVLVQRVAAKLPVHFGQIVFALLAFLVAIYMVAKPYMQTFI